MKSTRKLVAAGLAVATMFGTLGLAGCGGDDGAQESNPKTIKIWHYEEDNGAQGKAEPHPDYWTEEIRIR